MKLLLKQKLLSFLDSFNVFYEDDSIAYTVKSRIALGKNMFVYNANGNNVAQLKQKILKFLPTYEIYMDGTYMGCVKKKLTLFMPEYILDYKGWSVEGDILGWDFSIYDNGTRIMTVEKELLNLTDTYTIDIADDANALEGLLIALAIDAEKRAVIGSHDDDI